MYNYKQAVKDDCVEAIKEWIAYHKDETEGMSQDKLHEKLYDAFWINDSVTGNASGSYTFSAYEAEKNLSGNWNLLGEAMEELSEEIEKATKIKD